MCIAIELMKIAQTQKLDSNILKAYSATGKSYTIQADYPSALKAYGDMLKLAEKTNDFKSQALANLGIGYVYKITGEMAKKPEEWEKSTALTQRALEISRKHNLPAIEVESLNSLAILYDMRKMHQQAIEMYKAALVVLQEKVKDKRQELILLLNTGISLKNSGRLNEALISYQKASSIADSMHLDYEKAFVTGNTANLLYKMENFAAAKTTALDALKRGEEQNVVPIKMDIYDLLIKITAGEKKYDEAYQYSTRLSSLKDSIFNVEKSEQLKDLQAKYETEIKDKTIGSQQDVIAFNKKQNLFLWIGMVLLSVIVAVVVRSQVRTNKLNRKITRQQEELLQQKQELQTVNGVKDRLFSVISHDLRTPVNSLISFTMLLENGNISPEKLAAYSKELKNNLGYVSGLMENLLHFAKSQMGGYNPALETFLLADVIHETIQLLQPVADAKRIKIINTINEDTAVRADVNMTTLAVRNLLGNAIKFSHAGTEIYLENKGQEKGRVSFAIRDNGVGMDAELQEIFNDDFAASQLDSTMGTQNEKGTGLGLMLCKKFIGLMGGSIKVNSVKGKGSSFEVTLPAG